MSRLVAISWSLVVAWEDYTAHCPVDNSASMVDVPSCRAVISARAWEDCTVHCPVDNSALSVDPLCYRAVISTSMVDVLSARS
jgi:hypothetical protein